MIVPSKKSLLRNLIVLSRFNKHSPFFTTFAGVWSVLLAGAAKFANESSDISIAFIFRQAGLCFLAAYTFCGAGVVWNDWIDRDIDIHVTRTRDRPLAAGILTTTEAMLWMILEILASCLLLHIMLHGKDVWKHLTPVMVASSLYPFGKRPSVCKLAIYPQYILGFTVAWPAIPGRAAIHGEQESFTETAYRCLPLCVMVYFWTVYINTAYSYQDVADDRKMNLNSLYSFAGRHVQLLLMALVIPTLVCIPIFLRHVSSAWLWMSWMGVWTASFAAQLSRFDPEQPASGGSLHKTNFVLGMWTTVACVAEVLLRAQ